MDPTQYAAGGPLPAAAEPVEILPEGGYLFVGGLPSAIERALGLDLLPWQRKILAELTEAYRLGHISPNALRWARAAMRPRGKSLADAVARLRHAARAEGDDLPVSRGDLLVILDEYSFWPEEEA